MKKWNSTIPQYERTNGNHTEKELSRILTAAVINSQFRNILLSNPDKALRMGFAGQPFHLNSESYTIVARIQARSLPDFARQLNSSMIQVCPA